MSRGPRNRHGVLHPVRQPQLRRNLTDHRALDPTAGMREINVDAKKELLTVGAGVRTGDIARVLARTPGRGGLMLPMGVCPSVGISGLAPVVVSATTHAPPEQHVTLW